KPAGFRGAEFEKPAGFRGAEFEKPAGFRGAEFEKPAGFRGAEFEHRRCEEGLAGSASAASLSTDRCGCDVPIGTELDHRQVGRGEHPPSKLFEFLMLTPFALRTLRVLELRACRPSHPPLSPLPSWR
ncbi:pentapeptide repeat-containing protein, partial [Methanoculleus sp.]|uniref:pentapeptide repeat-containing protein n=1 Tax=Methanoculleus sp. TaxID=90427 RepID=UPI001BD482D5